jgi:hypothetical protein
MTSVAHVPPPDTAFFALLDGADALAVPTRTGYRVQLIGQQTWVLCDRLNPNLVILGHRDLAAAQREADEQAGGLAALVCGYGKGR